MDRKVETALQQRITELEVENARMKDSLEFVKAVRRALREQIYGPVPESARPTEQELIETMKDHVPGQGLTKFLAELGIVHKKSE